MKRPFLILIALIALCIAMAAPVCAAANDLVTDGAGLLTNAQLSELNDRASDITEKFECEVSIFIVEDMGMADAYAFATQVYNNNEHGFGQDRSGLMLMLSMADRDYALISFGFGNTTFTDHVKDVMLDSYVLPLLSKGDYYEAFVAYFDKAAEFLAMARAGTPFDNGADTGNQGVAAGSISAARLVLTIVISVVVALIVCLILLRQMKTARMQRSAANYIPQGGFVITGSSDTYLYSTETRRTIEEKDSSSTDSGGFSGRSGKF